MSRVNYKRIVISCAMNKSPYQSGIDLSLENEDLRRSVLIQAINPKTNDITSYLKIRIPYEDIDEVIKCLQDLKKNII